MRSGNRRQRRQELRAREHPLGVVGVKPHPLPLIRAQRPPLLPDTRIDCDPSEVVDERRASKRHDAGFVDPATPRRRRGQLRHARGVTRQIRRHQIGEVAHRGEPAIERLALEPQPRMRLARERLLPHRRLALEREDPLGIAGETGGHLRVERMARPLADEAHDALLTPEQALERGIHGDVDDPHRQRDLLTLRTPERSMAVPALDQVHEQA
jgi:hypothetical protein